MANIQPQTWKEICLVTLWNGTTFMEMSSWLTPSDIFDGGARPVEYVPTLKGGRLRVEKPEEDTVLTFEGRFVGVGDIDSTAPDGMIGHFYDATDTSSPMQIDNVLAGAQRKAWSIWLLWSDDSTVASGTGAIVSGANAMRCRMVCASFESCKPSFGDGEKKWTFSFRVPARTQSGAKTITWESTDGTASMASLGTLTST